MDNGDAPKVSNISPGVLEKYKVNKNRWKPIGENFFVGILLILSLF
jgi:hypothetical protein